MSRLKLDKEDSLREITPQLARIPGIYILQMAANLYPIQVNIAKLIIADMNCSNSRPSCLPEGLGLNYSIISHIYVYYLFHVHEC